MMELNPKILQLGTRSAPFTRELYIEREDFMEEPVKKFFRLAPGKEVRLKRGLLRNMHRFCQRRKRQCGRSTLHI